MIEPARLPRGEFAAAAASRDAALSSRVRPLGRRGTAASSAAAAAFFADLKLPLTLPLPFAFGAAALSAAA